jgi:hypothetical protein
MTSLVVEPYSTDGIASNELSPSNVISFTLARGNA